MSASLLAWYDRSRRELPWRRDRDPYRVLVSEVMLQQTRVSVVEAPFTRFLARFPSVEALALAPVEDVLAAWSGLGYYRRARNLHAAARAIAAAGGFPPTLRGLRDLPGVGDYTAAAVGSIAFGWAEPVLDGNVERVLSRLTASAEDPKRTAQRRRLREQAAGLLDPARPGDSNQALMELGATVCLPVAPRCPECPLRTVCLAAAAGEPERYPPPRRRRATERIALVAAVVEGAGRVLLARRRDAATLLGGTWEVPWVEAAAEPGAAPAAAFAARYGGSFALGEACGEVRHTITYRAFRVAVRRARHAPGASVGADLAWFRPAELPRLPHSSLVQKILARAGCA